MELCWPVAISVSICFSEWFENTWDWVVIDPVSPLDRRSGKNPCNRTMYILLKWCSEPSIAPVVVPGIKFQACMRWRVPNIPSFWGEAYCRAWLSKPQSAGQIQRKALFPARGAYCCTTMPHHFQAKLVPGIFWAVVCPYSLPYSLLGHQAIDVTAQSICVTCSDWKWSSAAHEGEVGFRTQRSLIWKLLL